jgi:hypothetical protein
LKNFTKLANNYFVGGTAVHRCQRNLWTGQLSTDVHACVAGTSHRGPADSVGASHGTIFGACSIISNL